MSAHTIIVGVCDHVGPMIQFLSHLFNMRLMLLLC